MAETSHSAKLDQITRARELLGDEAEGLTDDEVRTLLDQARAVARGIVEARMIASSRA